MSNYLNTCWWQEEVLQDQENKIKFWHFVIKFESCQDSLVNLCQNLTDTNAVSAEKWRTDWLQRVDWIYKAIKPIEITFLSDIWLFLYIERKGLSNFQVWCNVTTDLDAGGYQFLNLALLLIFVRAAIGVIWKINL